MREKEKALLNHFKKYMNNILPFIHDFNVTFDDKYIKNRFT